MLKRLNAVVAAFALAGGVAFAEDVQKKDQQQTGQTEESMPAIGGAGEMQGEMGKEITGEVIKMDKRTLYLQHMGAVVPLKIERNTKFEGGLTRDQLKQGQQVRASFMVQDQTNNIAVSIGMAEGTGGALEEPLPQKNLEPMPQENPDMPSGGSGTDVNKPVEENKDIHQ